MTIKKTAKANDKLTAKAFFNYEILNQDGSYYRAKRGLPLFQNPEYPDADIDSLITLAEKNNDAITLTMRVTININKPREEPPISNWAIA